MAAKKKATKPTLKKKPVKKLEKDDLKNVGGGKPGNCTAGGLCHKHTG